jgi:TolB-like protein/Flp pilus assembly protein TadD
MLYVRTFGGCHVERDGVRFDDFSTQRQALACLAYLACAGAAGVTRDAAAALLWPESDEERARASLKQLVHSVRTRLGAPDVVLTSGDLRLNPLRVTSDVGAFRDAVREGALETAARLYTGPFLAGFYLRAAPTFEQWSSEQRGALAHDFEGVTRKLAESADRQGEHSAALSWWRRLVDADPLSAPATLGLMRAYDAAGDRAAALRQATAFQELVRKELAMEADQNVVDLANRLRAAPAARPVRVAPAARALGADDRPTLVVLPFVNTSGDPQDEPFTDGLTDELIGTIGKLRGLAVVGRTSAFAFKGREADAGTVAATLGVTSILEGSVHRVGGRLKVGVQLVRAPDGVVLWSEIYHRDARDIFAVQGDIARAVSLALRVRLDASSPSVRHSDTSDLAAHELYLRGRFFLNRVSSVDLEQAVGCFERAVERDSGYARAFAGLADATLLLAILGHAPAVPAVARVHAAVVRALALDGDLAEAHASLACVLFAFDWEWDAAEREFERAIELDPGYGLAHHRYGLYLMYRGRFDDALGVLESARASDPLGPSVNMNLGRLHLSVHRAAEAVPLLTTAIELSPRLALAHEQLGYAYLQLKQTGEALMAFRRVAELTGPGGETRMAYALAATGDANAALTLTNRVRRRPDAIAHAVGLALAYTGLGDRERAFEWLDRAVMERDAFIHTVAVMPAFEPLHADARWGVLLRRIGLLF